MQLRHPMFLASYPLQLRLYLHCFVTSPLRAPLQGIQNNDTAPGLTDITLEPCRKPPRPHLSHILHTCKTNTMWTMPSAAASLRSSWASLDYGYRGLWVHTSWTQENLPLAIPSWVQHPGPCSLKKSFKWACSFTPWNLHDWGLPNSCGALRNLLIVLIQSVWLLLLSLMLMVSSSVTLNKSLLWPNCTSCILLIIFFFSIPILTVNLSWSSQQWPCLSLNAIWTFPPPNYLLHFHLASLKISELGKYVYKFFAVM